MSYKSAYECVEIESRRGAYDMSQSYAIVQHRVTGDRYLVCQGFGGVDDLCGGRYRWRHGSAYKIGANDTLASLAEKSGIGNCPDTALNEMLSGSHFCERADLHVGLERLMQNLSV
jgi:hypothetical protein